MRTKNVQDIIDQVDLIAIPPSFVNRQEQYLIEGDILVSTANSSELVGKSCWVPKIDYKATAGGFISILRTDKEKIAATYLSIAFYGTKLVGLEGVSKLCNSPIENISYYDAIRIVSRLKYPEPSKNKERWNTRHEFRCEYLSKKLLTSAKGMVPDVAEKATPLIPSRAIKLDQ